MIALIFSASMVHAGWFSDWCQRHVIADDPFQYRELSTVWIERKIYALEIMKANRVASRADLNLLKGLRKELETRGNE